jgi:DNA-binding protein H-NS
MAYSIRLPDGTLVRNIPDELSPEEAKARIIKAYPQYAPETSTTRRVLGDVPVGVARGGVAGIRMIADLFGADNPASQALKDSEEYLAGLMSAQAQNNEQEMARLLKEAEDKGALESVKLGFQALAAAPVEIMSQVFGSAIPTILTGAAGALAKLGTFGVRTLQAGTGTAMGVGLAKGNIYEVVKEELTNAGIDEKVAEERAKAAQNYTGENWDQIIFSGLLGGAAALGPLERIFARLPAISPQVAAKNIFARSAAAGVAEAAPEAAQAFQEQVAQNLALQREGFDVPTFRGAVANATLEGLAGFGIGAPIGALEGKPGATKPPGQQDPTEPAAPPPPTPIVPEGELTPEEEAELQARIAAAPPPPAAVPVETTPPAPPTPAAVQPVTATPEAVALPEPQQVTSQVPVEAAPELEALTAQLGQIQQARMDPTLTPDDPAFLELDQQEAAIQTRIQQLTATPEAVTQPPAQPLAPPVAPVVEPEVIPAEALVEAPVVTPPQGPRFGLASVLDSTTQPLAPEITPPADVESVITPAVEEPVIEEPVARTKEDVQTELNRIRTSLKKAKTAVKKKLMPESEVTSLEARVSELEDELAEAKAGPRQIKYRSAKGNTWTGKGKSPPKWLREKLAAGYELSDFEIRPELGNKSEVELELEKPLGFGRPAPATRPPPEYERAARELEAAETTKPNLFSALTSKVSSEDAADVGTGPDFAFLRAAKGRGKPISEIISDGELDAYLPPDMRPGSETFNAKKASEYLKDLLRQDPATDPEARLTYESREFLIPILRNELDRLEAELEPEDVNQLIQEIIAEERAAIADLEASAIAEQERGPGVPPVPADFALTGQTPEELAELQRRELSGEAEAERDRLEAEEAARAAAEAERKIADQKRETFDLAPPPSAPTARAAAPSGDLFGTAGITEQPTRAPRAVAAEPSPIEKLAAEKDKPSTKKKPEAKKEEKPKAEQFVRGTEEQLKEIKEFAKRYGGSEVAYYDPDKDIGMVLAFGKFDGDPKYIPYIKGVFGRTAFDISVAKFSDVLPYKAELLEVKERLEKAAEKKHQENPFIKFERGIALSDGMDPKIEGIIREWKDMLGLGGINIYFSTTEDAKKNINNFTGPHRRIGSATIDANERGSMRRMEGGASYYVVFDKSTSTTKMLEVIAHEMGHVHEKVAFDQAPQELKDKLKAAYEKWLESRKDKTSREAIQMLRAKTTAKTTDIGQTIETAEQLDKLDPYWSKFSEWYADQVSRWAVTDEKPVGVVEKFFARLGAALRRFYQNLKGQGYLPDETFVQYLKQVKPTIVETIPGPIKDPVNQDMSSKMQTDLFGSPQEAKDIGEAMEVKGKKKLPPGRSPELTAAAQAVQAGTMTAEEFNKLVDVYKPIPLYAEPLKPATSEQVFDALDVKKREQINPQIPNGTKVGLRLDIPAFNRKGVFVVSIHQKRTASAPGKVIGYGSVAKAKNVTFGVGNQLKALEIAAGSAKDALQTIEGEYVNVTPEQAFAEAQRAIKDPSYVQVGIDPTRHAYFYDRRTTLPVVSAEEVIQIGNMILAKNPEFGSKQDFLYNIEGGPIAGDTQAADMSFLDRLFAEDKAKRKEERNETMAYYKSIRRKEAAMQRKVREYGSTLELQRQLNNLNEIARELKEDLDLDKQPVYSAENFLRQARAALEGTAPYQGQAISPEVFAVIQAVYMDDPKLLEGLRLSIKPEFSKQDQELRRAFGMKRQTAGTFMPMQRLINLYTGTRGVTSPATIRHELTHTLEQMMTEKQRQALLNSYLDAIKKAMRKHKDAKSQEFFDLVLKFLNNPTDMAVAKMNDAMPSMDFYQYTSPSEYWAVNAEKLMAQRLGTSWDRFKKAIRKVFEKMKKIFGFDNRFAVHDVFDKIMSGSKERMDRRALVDYIGTSGDSFAFLANIEEDAELVRRYNRADTPMLDHSPMRRMIVNAASFTKDTFKDMAQNPSEALRMMFNTLNRGVMYLRNKNIWFGSGINEADRIRYNGQLKTAEGLATASLALDNMVRGGNIATQVVFLGGIEFNKDTQMYSAAQKEKSMEKVYRAEAKLKEKLGDQLAANIINGYGEAKRSRSIKEEVETRTEIVEAINEEVEAQVAALKALDADPKSTKEQKDAVNRELRKLFKEYRQAREELNTITKIAEEKVTMSEAEIEDFISREDAHPELKEILDNFGAVNQNLLRFWKDVGLLNDPRYERLAAIKDYVPWYRIMNDEEDVHSPLQATTRSATNIGKEKLFKSGKPSVINDFIIEEGQDVFKIQPSRINAVKLNGVRLKPDQYESTPNGEVRLKVEYKPNDVLVIETQREIENMIDNMTRNVMRMTMNGLRKYAANRIVSEYATRDSKGQVMTFPKVDREKGRFDYIYNGRRTIVEIQDPLIAEAVLGMETVGMEMWKPLAAAANFTRRTITLSPVFQLKQVFKDAPTAALVTGVKNPAALMGGVMRDFVGAVRDNDPVATILRSHGIGGFYSPARTPEADVKRRIGIINNNAFDYTMKALDHFGDSSDMAQRIAIYKRVMAETGDESLALYQAANVINFLRHGSGQVAQALVKTVPFLNAYAQSIDVLFNALVGGGLRGKDRAAALKQLAVTGGLLAGTTLLYAMLVGDDDDYMKMDDQSKIRSYMIPGTDVVLPMNTSAAFFFKAIPELIYNKVVNEGTENEVDAKRLRTAMKEAAVDLLLGPTPVPSAVKPVIEISLDYNFFTSRPITPRGMDNLDAYQQYDMRTSDAARLLSGLTGTKENRLLNPMEADHLVRSIFGTAGAMVAWSSNLIGASSEYRPEMGLKDMPITGAFLRPEVPRGREDLFYKLKENTDRKYRTFNRLIERDQTAEAEAYLNRHPNLIAYYDYTSEMDTQLKEINAAIRFIGETQDPSYTPETKRREIQELLNLKQDILEGIEQFRKEAYAD